MRKFYSFILIVFISVSALSQTIIVTDDPAYTTGISTSMLDIKSTSKGLLIPRITLTAVLTSPSPVTTPATGLLVYNEGANQPIGFYYWNGSSWAGLAGGSAPDGSETKITAGTSITKTGSGTTGDPYVVTFTTHSVTKAQRDALSPTTWQYVWCSDCGISGEFQAFNGKIWTNSTGGTRTLAIGESFMGGKVAYIFQSGDPGFVSGEVHGIIAAAGDLTSTSWGCNTTSITGADGILLGTGNQNTTDVITGCGTLLIPAKQCYDHSVLEGGIYYKDWYLPSRWELDKLYLNRTAIGGFNTSTHYWSSSENASNQAFTINFNNSTHTSSAKSTSYRVRPIRNF